MSIYVKNILRIILLLALQILLLNNINLRWWSSENGGAPPILPFIYPLAILLLPIKIKDSYLLLIAFSIGIILDAFMDTGGMHAAACVLMAFMRKSILNFLYPTQLEEAGLITPSPKNMGWTPFITYVAILIGVHHLFYFIIEIWSFSSLGYLLIKFFTTYITSMLLILIYSLFVTTKSNA